MERQLLQSITNALPANFIRTFAQDVEWAYKEAHAANYGNPLLDRCDADYNYPYYRRSILEKRFRDTAGNYGLSVAVKENQARNYHYTEIAGGNWTFTLKHTSDEKYMLRSSIFRKQDASLNLMLEQRVMEPILGIVKAPGMTPCFNGIIFHATDREDTSSPGFIRIGIPREDFSWWEACFDIHELLQVSSSVQTEDEITAVARWKQRAKRNTSQQQ